MFYWFVCETKSTLGIREPGNTSINAQIIHESDLDLKTTAQVWMVLCLSQNLVAGTFSRQACVAGTFGSQAQNSNHILSSMSKTSLDN